MADTLPEVVQHEQHERRTSALTFFLLALFAVIIAGSLLYVVR